MNRASLTVTFALLTVFCLSVVAQEEEQSTYKVGSEVAPFTLQDAEGQEHDLSKDLGEKIIVLEFWNMNCPVSRGYIERMKALHEKYKEEDVVFYAIDSILGNEVEDIKKFAGEHEISYPILKDSDQKIVNQFNAQVTPEIFVIGKDKKVVYHGAVDNSQDESKLENRYLADALNALLRNESVKVSETKAFGCGIKRG